MDLNALRTWGIAASAACMAGALAVALQPQGGAEAEAQPAFEIAQAEPAAPVAFLVRFRGTGPIARAQAMAADGRLAAAQRQVEIELRRQRAFSGLCFDRFTVGGVEMVLRTCEPVASERRIPVQQSWLGRLQAMRAVAYVDANTTATQNRAG